MKIIETLKKENINKKFKDNIQGDIWKVEESYSEEGKLDLYLDTKKGCMKINIAHRYCLHNILECEFELVV